MMANMTITPEKGELGLTGARRACGDTDEHNNENDDRKRDGDGKDGGKDEGGDEGDERGGREEHRHKKKRVVK